MRNFEVWSLPADGLAHWQVMICFRAGLARANNYVLVAILMCIFDPYLLTEWHWTRIRPWHKGCHISIGHNWSNLLNKIYPVGYVQCHITNANQPSYGGCNICGSWMKSASQPTTGCPTGLNQVKGVLWGFAWHTLTNMQLNWPNLHVTILSSVYNIRMCYSQQTI